MDVGINYLAVLVAAISSMVVGSVWYAKGVFGAKWMADVGLTDEDTKKGAGKAMGVMFLMSILTALILSVVVDYMDATTAVDGFLAGLMAVDALHEQHISHGDVYAHNMLFDPRTGDVVLGDFGAATVFDEGESWRTDIDKRALAILKEELSSFAQ